MIYEDESIINALPDEVGLIYAGKLAEALEQMDAAGGTFGTVIEWGLVYLDDKPTGAAFRIYHTHDHPGHLHVQGHTAWHIEED